MRPERHSSRNLPQPEDSPHHRGASMLAPSQPEPPHWALPRSGAQRSSLHKSEPHGPFLSGHERTDFLIPIIYTLAVPPSSTAPLVARLERIRDLSADRARELVRGHGETVTARAIADTIKHDSDAVQRALRGLKR